MSLVGIRELYCVVWVCKWVFIACLAEMICFLHSFVMSQQRRMQKQVNVQHCIFLKYRNKQFGYLFQVELGRINDILYYFVYMFGSVCYIAFYIIEKYCFCL